MHNGKYKDDMPESYTYRLATIIPQLLNKSHKKKPNSYRKMFENFLEKSQENAPIEEKSQERKEQEEQEDKQYTRWEGESNDGPEIPDRGVIQALPASFQSSYKTKWHEYYLWSF